ncbi:unnamed protein product [Somion occarium]|uniref:NAD(P)-binding protein n=1 Tax=Somion occarium TaxID=3059160 RepID=A0ABP1DIK4_9APHY
MAPQQIWLITGAASGFGRAVTELVLHKGDVVIATDRSPEGLNDLTAKYPSSHLLVLNLDVTKHDQISHVFARVKKDFGRLDVVYNNAGYLIVGEVEGTSPDIAHALFETNFWGTSVVSQEAIKFFREVNTPGVGGRLLNVNSMSGIQGWAGVGYYSASKHAIEGLSESLAQELDPEWNIKITIIEPGAFRTSLSSTGLVKTPVHSAYAKASLASAQFRAFVNQMVHQGADPAKAAEKLYHLAHLPEPPLRLPLGKDAVSTVEGRIEHLKEIVAKYGSWSHDLEFDL